LIARWREIDSHINQSELVEVMPQVHGVMEWFDADELRLRALEKQDRALKRANSVSDRANSNELRSVIDAVVASGAEVPNQLRRDYVEKVSLEKRAKRLKAGVIAGGIAVVLFVVTSAAAIAYRGYRREAALVQMIEAVETSLESGELETADQLLDSAPRDDSRFDEFRESLSQKKLAEELRANEFRDAVAELRDLLDQAKEVEAFESLQYRVDELSDRATSEDEFAASRQLREYAETKHGEQKDAYVVKTEELIGEIEQGLKTLVPGRQARSKLTTWNQRIQQRRTNRWIRDDSQLLLKLDSTSNAVADQRDNIRKMADSEQSIAEITANVGDWDSWKSLGERAQESEGVVRSKLMALASCVEEERELWEGIEQWNPMAGKWQLEELLAATPQQASEVVADVATLQQSGLDDLPPVQDLVQVSKVAGPTSKRTARNLSLIRAHLQSPKMSELYAVQVKLAETTPTRWIYFRSPNAISVSGAEARITHWTDLELTETDSSTVPQASIRIPKDFAAKQEAYLSEGARGLIAPHVRSCANLLKQLSGLEEKPERWDQAFVASFREVVAAEGIDPIVQAFLVKSLLDIGSNGSWMIQHADHIKLIEEAKLRTDVNWISSTDEEAAKARRHSAEVVRKLRPVQTVNPAPRLQQLTERLVLDRSYEPIGWLDQYEGRWIVRSNEVPDAGPLAVRFFESGDRKTRSIGSLSDGEVVLMEDSGPEFRIGRPVFLEKTSTSHDSSQVGEQE
jgi:hypothetical protein